MSRIFFYKGLCVCALSVLILFPLRESGRSQQSSRRAAADRARLAEIPLRMKALVEQGTIAGAVMLVAKGGKVLGVEAVGYQDLESRKPMRVDTIFDIRSVTKPVTALGIMILMEEGKLALHDPVEKYLPEFRKTAGRAQRATGPITIYQLLTHTSGIPASRPREIEDITVTRNRTLAEVVTLLSKQEPEFAPGTRFRYSSSGFAILGRVIEVVSGKAYEQFMKERVFDPLGMKDSSFFIPAGKRVRVASIYRMEGGRLKKWEEIMAHSRNAKYPAPEFGMYSTAADLAALCQMMLDGGSFKGRRILSRASVEAMTQNHTLNIKSALDERPAYQGLAWGLSGDPRNDFPLTSVGSFGHNGAFGAIIWIDPQKRLIRIFLQHLFGFGNESNIFMAMAGAAVTD